MLTTCCDAWLSPPEQSTCVIQADPCQGSQEPIDIVQSDACPADSVFCAIVVYPPPGSCCVWDCRATASCALSGGGAEWSCCRGACDELFDDKGNSVGPNPACNSETEELSACCTATQIFLPGPSTWQSPEWIVGFGYASAPVDAAASANEQAPDVESTDNEPATEGPPEAAALTASDASMATPCPTNAPGGCRMSRSPAAPGVWLRSFGLCIASLTAAWARRRRRVAKAKTLHA